MKNKTTPPNPDAAEVVKDKLAGKAREEDWQTFLEKEFLGNLSPSFQHGPKSCFLAGYEAVISRLRYVFEKLFTELETAETNASALHQRIKELEGLCRQLGGAVMHANGCISQSAKWPELSTCAGILDEAEAAWLASNISSTEPNAQGNDDE